MENIKKNFFFLFLLFQPGIDLITALMTRYEVGFLSLGIIVKGCFLIGLLLYLFFFCKTKTKGRSIGFILLLFFFFMLYFLTKTEFLFSFSFLKEEVIYLFKYFYFPICFVCLFNLMKEWDIPKEKVFQCLGMVVFFYTLFLVLPLLTNTSFSSYVAKRGIGYVGWYYSANEISVVLISLFPFVLLNLDEKVTLLRVVTLIFSIVAALTLGTKVAYFGVLLFLICAFFFHVVHWKKKKLPTILILISLVVSILFSSNLPVMKNIQKRFLKYQENNGLVEDTGNTEGLDHYDDDKSASTIVVFSARDKLFGRIYRIYAERGLFEKLFGIGFSNRSSIQNRQIEKLIEMDFFDIFFRYGVVGFLLYFLPVAFLIKFLFEMWRKKKIAFTFAHFCVFYSVAISFAAAFISGHVLGSPGVSIFLSIACVMTYQMASCKPKRYNDQKITFLCLHLGTGGIEQSIINTCNALCKKIDVTILSFYHLPSSYQMDPRIHVYYLYEGGPNKKELKEAITEFHPFALLKNMILAFRILWKKRFQMIKEIKKIEDGVVVSTRMEFSTLLNSYGNDTILKIAQEHYHHNGKRSYIWKMKHCYYDIDYVFALTESLKKDYEKFLQKTNVSVCVIPNMIPEYEGTSFLDKKNIVFVGRVTKGKEVMEIVRIADEVRKSKGHFLIIGDGEELPMVKEEVEKRNLTKQFTFSGAMDHEKVMKTLESQSIFIMTSLSEGLPMVLLEAMSVGIPCIAYQTESGISDIITDGKDGFIILDRNRTLFVEKLNFLMNDVEKRKEMGAYAKLKAQEFQEEKIIKKWMKIIKHSFFSSKNSV